MSINFPHNPNVNDVHTESSLGKSWKWDGTTWLIYSSSTTGIGFSDLSVITEAASGGGSLTYASGVFTFKPSAGGGGGATNFTGLGDTPSSLTAGKWLKVNTGGTALEWTDAPSGSNTTYDLTASDGSVATEEKIILTGSDSSEDAVTLAVSGNLTIARSNNTITFGGSVPTTITLTDESNDGLCYPIFSGFETGSQPLHTNTSLTFNSASGQLEAGSFKKTGGTSSEFLKADGSVDSNTYTNVTYSIEALASPGIQLLDGGNAGASNRVFFDGLSGISVARKTGTTNTIEFSASLALNDLGDVDTTGAVNGKIIKHNGTSWVIADDTTGGGGGSSNFTGLADTPSSLTAGKWLKVNAGATALEWTDAPSGSNTTYDLAASADSGNAKITLSGSDSTNDDVTFSAGGGISYAVTGNTVQISSANSLGELSDVTISGSPSNGQVIKYVSGTGWTNDTDATGGGSTTINNNADNRIITGSATAGELNAESSLSYDGTKLNFSDDKRIDFGSNLRMQIYTDGTTNYIKTASDGSSPGAFPISIHSGPTEVINIDNGHTQIKTGLKDKDGDLGDPGQILSSTGTQVNWINAGGSTPNLNSVLTEGNTSSLAATVGDLTCSNLTVSGTTTTVNTATLNIADNLITLNSDFNASSPTENAGIEVKRGNAASTSIRWNETTDKWQYTNDGSTFSDFGTGGGEANVQVDWNQTTTSADDYIKNKPTIPAAQVQTDWNAATGLGVLLNKPTLFSGSYNDLSNKPTLFSGSYNDLSNKPTIPAAQIQSDWNQTNSSELDFIKNKPSTTTDTNDYVNTASFSGNTLTLGRTGSQSLADLTVNIGTITGVPTGTILMYNGDTAPAGWCLCDGVTRTINNSSYTPPDLRDKFIVGAGSSYNRGSTAGSADAVVVSHSHGSSNTGNESANHTHESGNYSGNASTHNGHTHGSGNYSGNASTHNGHTHSQSGSGSGNTGNQSHNHYHTIGGATTDGTPSKSSANTSGGTHGHSYQSTNGHPQSNMSGIKRDGGDDNNSTNNTDIFSNGGSHNHTVDLTGVTTGGINVNHTHSFNFNIGGNTGTDGNHSHNVNFSGNSGSDGNHSHNVNFSGSSGAQSANHTHSFTVGSEGVSGTGKNLPPYYAITFIIKT